MKAARLHGARDFRIEEVPAPPAPEAGEALIHIESVGVCGSDLHTYQDGRIGDTVLQGPLVLGHEFAGTVSAVGEGAYDGQHQLLEVGQRVAVEPALPCGHCDRCEQGNPNLCRNLGFMGLWPHHGALQECRVVPAHGCFPLPDALSMEEGALLEPLGVAIHAVDLGHLRIGHHVVVLGCGPIGLMIMKLARLSGASVIYAFDQFEWRLDAARRWGADVTFNIQAGDPVEYLRNVTKGRGADVVFEAAWAGEAVGQAVEMADLGGRLVLVGIPGSDEAHFKHSTARRKGLTMMMCRRMKHTYPRAIDLVFAGSIDLKPLVTHRFTLVDTDQAFALNSAYSDNVIKVMINL
jgi:L-iditol 2-dehydrogenase